MKEILKENKKVPVRRDFNPVHFDLPSIQFVISGYQRTKDDDVQRLSASVFVTNLPDGYGAKDLWNTCKLYGNVVDAYIPDRRSKAGKRFGFVRFIKEPMNKHIPKGIDKGPKASRFSGSKNSEGAKGMSNPYAHVVKGNTSHKEIIEDSPSMALDESCENQDDFSLSLLGKVKEFASLNNLKVVLVGSWFSRIIQAHCDFVIDERVMWVEIEDETIEEDGINEDEEHGNISENHNRGDDESDGEEIPETIFEDVPDNHISDVNSIRQSDVPSEDPFGFTPEDASSDYVVKPDILSKKNIDSDNKDEGGGSIIHLIDELVNVGQTMGYDMTGCLAEKAKNDWVKELCIYNKVNFLSLQETKMKKMDMWGIKRCWGNYSFEFVYSESVGKSGGILSVWDPNMFRKDSATISDYFNIVRGVWLPSGTCLLVISVYAPQELSEKKMLWNYLSNVIRNWDGEVISVGDFNEVRDNSERFGSIFNRSGAEAFNSFIVNSGLVKVPLGGCSFTWCHKSASKMSKLDSKFMLKLKYLKETIRKWYSSYKFQDMEKIANLEVVQKAKIKWAIEGDENSKYYHGVLNKKRGRLAIRGVLVDGNWIEAPNLVKNEFFEHFKNRFNQPNQSRITLVKDFVNKISMEMVDLERKVSKEEIKRAVWDCGVDKAPRPDGFAFGFYRRYWDLIENDVSDAIKWFFLHGYIPKGGNSSFITLIPKVSNANMVKDFRPISLIGSLYKIIAKVLAIRLALVIDDLVNENQSAFVPDRQVLDGSFILNEIVQWCKSRKKQSSKVGDSMSRIHPWNEVIDGMNARLSRWKLKTLSIGGRLTLLKSVLGATPIYHMSIFKGPMKVLHTMETIRSRFFKGAKSKSNKQSWVGWNKVLASKESGGLGVSSLFALNRALMFNIIKDIEALKKHDIDLINFIKPKALETMKSIDVATKISHGSLDHSFRRKPRGGAEQMQFELLMEMIDNVILNNSNDIWIWTLVGSGEFSVSSVRKIINDTLLPSVNSKTRWINVVPIKINVLAWKVKHDYLPTRLNLSRRDHAMVEYGLSGY
nr:RNA-directed DNA polymerase, eukaryota, reverse transcriptase zinc-binding domain protein [Tanacetum cinerariifolium]